MSRKTLIMCCSCMSSDSPGLSSDQELASGEPEQLPEEACAARALVGEAATNSCHQ